MDCTQAKQLISEALDRAPVDAAALEAAKQHCRECEECAGYVRALNAVRRAGAPQPPADLADRVMQAVRADADAAARREAAKAAALESALAEEPVPGSTEPAPTVAGAPAVESVASSEPTALEAAVATATGLSAREQRRVSVDGNRPNRRQLIAWGSAAAVLVVAVTVSAALGVMRLATGGSSRSANLSSTEVAAPTGAGAPAAAEKAASDQVAGSQGATGTAGAGATQPAATPKLYVVFQSTVYTPQPESSESTGTLTLVGQVRMTFDTATPPDLHDVYKGSASNTIFIKDSSGTAQRFVAVTRQYKGTTYRLQSGELVGGWPTMPPGIQRPIPENNPTGAPVFVYDGDDSSGVKVYHRVGMTVSVGIAIPPGTPATDPAAGNPNWTVWIP